MWKYNLLHPTYVSLFNPTPAASSATVGGVGTDKLELFICQLLPYSYLVC